MIAAVAPLVLALLVALAGTFLLRAAAPRLGLVSVPGARSSHHVPTPHGGGLAIAVATLLAWCWAAAVAGPPGLWQAAALCALAAGLGFWDDLRGLPVHIRFAVQTLVALGLVAVLAPPLDISVPVIGAVPDALAVAVLALAGVWWTNLFNFMDGTDGFAAAQTVFMAGTAFLLALAAGTAGPGTAAVVMLAPAIAAAGFLLFNRPPASIFMGDAGSLFLGTALYALALIGAREGWLPLAVWAVLGLAFIADASVALLRRALRGANVLAAHRSHAYQRLARRWDSHARVLAALLAVDLLWLVPLAWCALFWVDVRWPLVLVAAVPVVVGVWVAGAGLPDES